MRHARVVLLFTVAGALAATAPAAATVTPGSAGGARAILESDDAGDSMSLSCTNGQVHYPGPPTAVDLLPCADTTDISITGNGGNDSVNLSALVPADFPKLRRVIIELGDTGDTDTVKGSQMADTIAADASDSVTANGGNDDITRGAIVLAGDGNDLLRSPAGTAEGGAGDDRFLTPTALGPFGGGPGFDVFEIDLPPDSPFSSTLGFGVSDTQLTITAEGSSQTISHSGMDRVYLGLINGGTQVVDGSAYTAELRVDGRGGPDTITGGPGEDFLDGGTGDDSITGGPGFDYVVAGPGTDTLALRDGEVDRARCGPDADSVVADTGDVLSDCEAADLPAAEPPPAGPPAPAPDTAAPELVLSGATLAGRVLSFTAACPATEARCVGGVALKAKGGKRGGGKAKRSLGRTTFSLAGGASAVVSRRVSSKQAKAVGKLRKPKLKLTLDVFDAAGNQAVQRGSLALTK